MNGLILVQNNMEHKENIDVKGVEQFTNDFANNLANAFAEFGKASEEAAKCCSSAIRTVTASAVVSELERLVCKYEKHLSLQGGIGKGV